MVLISTGILLLYLHFIVGVYNGYYKKWWFGSLVHLTGGMFLGLLSYWYTPGAFFLPFGLAILWELWEFAFDWMLPKWSPIFCWYSRSLKGALHDILVTWLGIIIIFSVVI